MARYTKSMQILIEEFSKMPGIGHKSAERMAFYILKIAKKEAADLASAIIRFKDTTGFCGICSNLSEGPVCDICQNANRDKSIICVVEGPTDVVALEKAGGYNGVYHVLMGALSPLEGIGPGDIRIKELADRIKQGGIKEVIIATDCDMDGEATALYLVKVLKELNAAIALEDSARVTISQIAYGVPVGGNLEYADHATLAKALEGRRQI